MQVINTGWTIILVSNGQQSGINFPGIESAMACYNSILSMIQAVGVPSVFMHKLEVPKAPEESKIVGVDGDVIREAVNAADLHPDLAGGDGAGMAENDDLDEEFELTDEDLELLENPVIDESELDEAFAEPDSPPVAN